MIAPMKNAFLNNITLKIMSLILGYSLWCFIGTLYVQKITQKVPICFYNVPDNLIIEAKPELVTIDISGKRSAISSCNDLAIHIDASPLTLGEHRIAPTSDILFLPETVSLVHYEPLVISLTVTKKA